MKEKARIDLAVLILFFCRDRQLEKVFEAVKKARPSKIYLFQDGPRKNRPDDMEGILKCRQIVSDKNIDWECQVFRNYQDENLGCDPAEYYAQKWMFDKEEMGIVLEDDDVPSQSFFVFCKELLEKYKDDERINIICGMNNTNVSKHIDDSYLFTKKGSIWGWASWKRVIDTWDGTYGWVNDEKILQNIERQMGTKEYDKWMKTVKIHRESGKEHYESIMGASLFIYDRLNIVPKYNMISNIGIGAETTHSTDDIRLLPRRIQNLLFKKVYEIDFPLKHPDAIERDFVFEKKMTPSGWQYLWDRFEHIFRVLYYKGIPEVYKLFARKIRK